MIEAVKEIDLNVPLVVRLEGTNVEQGRELLSGSGLDLIPATDLTTRAQKICEAIKARDGPSQRRFTTRSKP